MCGIYASVSKEAIVAPSDALKQLLHNRGPDHTGEAHSSIKNENRTAYWIYLMSTVLSLRGSCITTQPFTENCNMSSLCWNGEAWRIGSRSVIGNDGKAVFDLLVEASSQHSARSESRAALLDILQSISGPFAFVYFDAYHRQLYFGRDRLGRRSLLYEISDKVNLQLSSVADPMFGTWHEVEADAIYSISFDKDDESTYSGYPSHESFQIPFGTIHRHSWIQDEPHPSDISIGIFNKELPSQDFKLDEHTSSIQSLRHHLNKSLKHRILDVPLPSDPSKKDCEHTVRIAILFSGGLDCTVLARLAHDILPISQEVDLINVAFENPRVVKAARKTAMAQKKAVADHLIEDSAQSQQAAPEPSFEELSPFECCPDRETGRKALKELQDVCSGRTWRFVAVDVPYSETLEHRASIIHLMYPHNTEMDLSIGSALYFASRGVGSVSSGLPPTNTQYSTPARVLLSGLGADELFGGYTRHATAFSRTGYQGLVDELKLDVDRLGKRNLGRDDRVISHWAREARFPYLDEAFVKWAVECPVWQKCGFQQSLETSSKIPDLEPGKKVLRLLARELGMASVATEKKRAIQFGARTAKMEVGRTKGTTLVS